MTDPPIQDVEELDTLLATPSRIHLIGIGGMGMAGLAILLLQRGHRVSGSELCTQRLTRDIAQRGGEVHTGHAAAYLSSDTQLVIRSTAIPANNPEWEEARVRKLPVYQRGQVLPRLLPPGGGIAISGTHGKTTTTSMIAWVFRACGRSVGFCVGGESDQLGAVADLGTADMLVVEADESDGTLVYYHPQVGVLTNMEFDHMEHFENQDAFVDCFRQFARQTRQLVYCLDDENLAALGRTHACGLSYGFQPGADCRATDFTECAGGSSFKLTFRGKPFGQVRLGVPGRHNVRNTLAALAVGAEQGLPLVDMVAAMESFQSPRRRFETVVQEKGITVINDYAHHPTEIRTVVEAARTLEPRRIIAVFQPHRYTRTLALGEQFPPSFIGVNEVVLTPVYAASEAPLAGGTSLDLAQRFNSAATLPVRFESSLEKAWQYLQTRLRSGDVLLVIGAGDVEQVAYWAKDYLKQENCVIMQHEDEA